MKEIFRWRCCLGRHIRRVAGFSGQRATDRRLSKLIDSGLVERRRILYGIPGVYSLTTKGKKLLNVSTRPESIRIEQITHDILVLDTVIYFLEKYGISLSDITSEKELHSADGFSNRKHKPDFCYCDKNSQKYCVEIELNEKAKARFEKNINDNFINYDYQKWIVPNAKVKIKKFLEDSTDKYPNIEIISLEEVTEFVRNL